ncbi:MAG: SgcJ/EcaC family oxidoreductase [Planctomycetaceae bacterium]|nr:SgcJ/EcaC family oxidoreductase [Planctomycetaceae bacterium]
MLAHAKCRIESDTARLSSADESAVRSVVSEFAKTWNRHDMKAMHELNTADVEWINVTANHWRGNKMVHKGHDTIHRTVFAKTDMSVDQTLVRAIAPDVAIAVATMKFGPVTIPSGEVLPELRTRGSFTMVKEGGSWKIAHFQNTNIDADAEKNDPATWDETGFLPGRKSP